MTELEGPLVTPVVWVRNLDGVSVPIILGITRGRRRLGLFVRVGEHGDGPPLGPRDAAQLIVNLREMIALLSENNST
ncbi:MAG: hypothetical protein ACRDQ7_21015 [Haloechinothrix sp.]